jgi:hypothetical protein
MQTLLNAGIQVIYTIKWEWNNIAYAITYTTYA